MDCFTKNTNDILAEIKRLKIECRGNNDASMRASRKLTKLENAITLRDIDVRSSHSNKYDPYAPRRVGGTASIRGINAGGKIPNGHS